MSALMGAALSTASSSQPPANKGGDADGKLRLTAELKPQLRVGNPVPVKLAFVNNTKASVAVIWEKLDPFRVTVTVKDAAGKEVPLTRCGKRAFGVEDVEAGGDLPNRDGSIQSTFVKAGESCDLSIANLALYFDLTLPGEYELSASIGTSPEEVAVVPSEFVRTGSVRFRIVP